MEVCAKIVFLTKTYYKRFVKRAAGHSSSLSNHLSDSSYTSFNPYKPDVLLMGHTQTE